MWLVMVKHPWSDLSICLGGFPLTPAKGPGLPDAFVPLFEHREAAERWSQGKYVILEVAEGGGAVDAQ